jgi:hypothetical protein
MSHFWFTGILLIEKSPFLSVTLHLIVFDFHQLLNDVLLFKVARRLSMTFKYNEAVISPVEVLCPLFLPHLHNH